MNGKMKLVLSLVVLLGLAGSSQAGLFWGNASGDWAAITTWSDRVVPSPTSVDDIAITIGGVTINVTTDGQGAVDLYHGYHVGINTLNIAPEIYFQITHVAQVGLGNDTDSDATGIVNVYGTFYAEMLKVGVNQYTKGIVNIYEGGAVNVGAWGCDVGKLGANGTGLINLIGGTMTIGEGSDLIINPKGRINIEAGTLSVYDPDGSQEYYINEYIADGYIIGYNGNSTLDVLFDESTNFVNITSPLYVPPVDPCAINPTPADGQRRVALSATLSWTGNAGATHHDVYLGTNPEWLENASMGSPEFMGRQSTTSFTKSGGLDSGTTYYWRIDEVVNSTVYKGVVWKFSTERTEPIVLTKGIVLDRQFHGIPPESWNTIDEYDVALIKRMGFNFAKVMVNPAPMISGSTINATNMAYVDEIVNRFLDQSVPVVVCIHPEPSFKTTYLGSAGGFTTVKSFYHDFAGYLAARWGQNEVVFQLMTEPFGNYTNWNTMLPELVSSVRSAMPSNTLIIGGAESGKISGLTAITQTCINTINDNNVYWGFTYWDEANLLPFMFQGAGFGGYYPYLKNVPYPSSSSNNPADYILPTIPSGDYNAALSAVSAYCNSNWNMAKQQSVLQPIIDWKNARGGNLKLICYEMGVPIDAGQAVGIAGGGVLDADRIQYIHDKRLALEEKNIGWTYWSFNETFTVLNYPLRVAFEKGVTKDQISSETMNALGMPCGCGCVDEPPFGDLNQDCYINFEDFAVIASSWLVCNEPTDPGCLQ